MNVTCNQNPCPLILGSQCVFYYGTVLPYTGIDTNDSLQQCIQKIENVIEELENSGFGEVVWGNITGTITDQTDLVSYLNSSYYPLTNPSGFIPGSNVPMYETDPVFTAWVGSSPNISLFNNDVGYLTSTTGDNLYWKLSSGGILTADNTISGNFNKFFTGTGAFVIGHSAVTTPNTRLQVRGVSTTSGTLALFEDSAGTERFKILDNGNVSGRYINIENTTNYYTSLGGENDFAGAQSVTIGWRASAKTSNVIAIGSNALYGAGTVGTQAIGIGKQANFSSPTVGQDSISIGYNTITLLDNSIAIGAVATAKKAQQVCIGYRSGDTSGTHGENSLSLGYHSNFGTGNIGDYSIALGQVNTSAAGAFAMGWQSSGLVGVNSVADSFALIWGDSTPDILFAKTADMYIKNSTGGLVFGDSSITANTKLDIRGFGTTTDIILRLANGSNIDKFNVLDNGNVAIGGASLGADALNTISLLNGNSPTTSPANAIQLWAEDLASSSKLKMRDEAGNIGFVPIVLYGSDTLNFPNTAPNGYNDLTITVTGAALNDTVEIGVPNGSVTNGAVYWGWVSATDTITIRFFNGDSISQNPDSGTFKVKVSKF